LQKLYFISAKFSEVKYKILAICVPCALPFIQHVSQTYITWNF